jgi:preprotein translocase subunit SecF
MNIMRFRPLFFAISLTVLLPGILSLLVFGLRPSIDFTGGTLLEVRGTSTLPTNRDEIQAAVGDVFSMDTVQISGENQIIIRGQASTNDQKAAALQKMSEKWGELEVLRFETVGPTLGRELLVKMLTAVVIVSIVITLYVWRQFSDLKFGIAAVLAMFHDTLVLLGSFSIFGWLFGIQVDVLFVTAVLTTLSFSVHDTIVVFDRIRELTRKHHSVPTITLVNAAVLETMSRSINNSVTIIVMLCALSLLGGESIRWFAVALLIGSVTGTYSSTFTAVPLLLLWDDVARWRKQRLSR